MRFVLFSIQFHNFRAEKGAEQGSLRNNVSLKFDEIGQWSELKLEIVEKYGKAYTGTLKNTTLKKYYIDAFSGAGIHVSKKTGEEIKGSPARAMEIDPPFDGYYFIDLNPEKTEHLGKLTEGKQHNISIHTGDCNEYLTKQVLPNIQYDKYNRALCLLDPYGLHLDWNVIQMAGQSRAVDMFLNFPVMDMNRNAIWKNPEDSRIRQEDRDRMTAFWGDESWRTAAYREEPDLFGLQTKKQENEDVVAAFVERLKKTAGFRYVAKPLSMKNSNNAVVYYLIFASGNNLADKIITDIFKKYE
ncbi:MAG: three-Cys-motif partner protein TcmP [Micavibrio sp.]